MNIYKNTNSQEIYCSYDGCPEGWIFIGKDIKVNDFNKNFVIGFENDNAIFSSQKNQIEKQMQIDIINKFYTDKLNSGVIFSGIFMTDKGEQVSNPIFQYDEISQNRLLKLKDFEQVLYWRSLDNKNILLSVQQKNELYITILTEWGNDFNNRLIEIEELN